MRPHPDYADRDIPRRAEVGGFRLRVLTPADLDDDMAALAESAASLKGLFGDEDWPEGIAREEDLVDLCWHAKEFDDRRSFAWVIADAADRYLGCAYLLPSIGERGRAEGWFWFRDAAAPQVDQDAFAAALDAFFDAPPFPPMVRPPLKRPGDRR